MLNKHLVTCYLIEMLTTAVRAAVTVNESTLSNQVDKRMKTSYCLFHTTRL